MITQTPIPNDVRTLIDEIIEYSWADEMDDYKFARPEMEDPDDHIFVKLVRLNNWLNGLTEEPDALVDYTEDSE